VRGLKFTRTGWKGIARGGGHAGVITERCSSANGVPSRFSLCRWEATRYLGRMTVEELKAEAAKLALGLD
jgi:hypothetical protein